MAVTDIADKPKPSRRPRKPHSPAAPPPAGSGLSPLTAPKSSTIVFRDVKSLEPYSRNAKKHPPAQIKQLAASMARWGFTMPLLVEGTNIVGGHGRLEAALSIWRDGGKIPGLEAGMIPCIEHAFLNSGERRAYAIADNKLAENALWDDELLKLEFTELGSLGFDLTLTGFTTREIDFTMAPSSDHSRGNRVSQSPADPNFVAFEFGEYKGKVSRKLYQRFQGEIESAKAAGTAYVLDDILKQWIGIQ